MGHREGHQATDLPLDSPVAFLPAGIPLEKLHHFLCNSLSKLTPQCLFLSS